VDRSIQDFVQNIQKNFPNTVVLIWGDHTPGINSADYRQASFTYGSDYYEFVPFIMATPDHKTYRESTYAASFLDICPTILYETGTAFTIKTNGINLASPPAVLPTIPFKEKLHDRKSLFDKITRETEAQEALDSVSASSK
jgi:phosphoglycerol transferase MdoB-like AlkP superfamily enzyme